MEAIPFFDGYTYGELVLMLVSAVVFLMPNAGVRFLNWLKETASLEDMSAHLLIFGVLTLLSLMAMAVTGLFTEINWTLKTVLSQIMSAMVPAELAYQRLKLKAPWGNDEGK